MTSCHRGLVAWILERIVPQRCVSKTLCSETPCSGTQAEHKQNAGGVNACSVATKAQPGTIAGAVAVVVVVVGFLQMCLVRAALRTACISGSR